MAAVECRFAINGSFRPLRPPDRPFSYPPTPANNENSNCPTSPSPRHIDPAGPARYLALDQGGGMAAKALDTEELKTGGVAADRLRSLVDRIERLEEERKALGADIKDIYAEAKSAGFDVKALRQLIRIRKQEAAEVEELETLLDVYRRALGM
jgi:uncharacterized protein (UPF0335 family)